MAHQTLRIMLGCCTSRTGPALLFILVLTVAASAQDGAEAPAHKKDYAEDYHAALKDGAKEVPGLTVYGFEASDYVHFEPEGLHITLPLGHPRQRPFTGVRTDFGVKGDFEVTVSFEFLAEPAAGVSNNPTDLKLMVVPNDSIHKDKWHRTTQNRASLSREAPGRTKGGQFVADATKWNNENIPRDKWGNEKLDTLEQHTIKKLPATAKTGRLRLVRTGPLLYFYANEEAGKDFTLLQKYEFGVKDLKSVYVVATTGNPATLLDVLVTDLHLRADALLKGTTAAAPETPPSTVEPSRRNGWLMLVFTSVALVGLALPVALWLLLRSRAASSKHVPVADVISFGCPGCGKRLKAKPERAGTKLKCPQCGKTVPVPDADDLAKETP